MKRVTPKSLQDRQNNKEKYADLPKLKDILVNLSVSTTPKVVKKLRLIGPAVEFTEIQDKKRVAGTRNTERIPFPDSDKNKSPTRIGHDDVTKCPWKQMGYIGARRFAQRCIEEQEDGTWVHKILVKGPSVFDFFFDWEQGRRDENDPTISCFLGGDVAPPVKIQALSDSSKLGGVEYKVFDVPKDMPLTEEIINMLRAVREPSVDELNTLRAEYNEERKLDPSMPEWRDYFEYGHDIRRIFKFTPPVEEANQVLNNTETAPSTSSASSETTDATTSVEAEEKPEEEEVNLEELSW